MSVALGALGLLAGSLAAAALPPDAGQSDAIVLHLVAPKGRAPGATVGEMLGALARALAPRAKLEARSVEQAGIDPGALDGCAAEERLACWVREAGGSGDPPAYLLVLAAHPAASGDDVYAMLIPIAEARLVLARSSGRDAAEAQLAQIARETAIVRVETANAAALEAYFAKLLDEEFRPMLARFGHWGARVRAQAAAGVELEHGPGDRGLAGGTGDGKIHPVRLATRWGGLAVLGAGAALAIGAGADHAADSGVWSACLVREAGADAACASRGAPWLSIGLAMVAAGGTWSLSTWLLGQEEEAPWLELAIGAAAGAAVVAGGILVDAR